MSQVFVSYSRNDSDAVGHLVGDLKAVGVGVWYDQALTGGQKWWDDILGNLRDSDAVLYALSAESSDSEACKAEVGYALALGKPVMPVIVTDGVNLSLLPSPLSEIQAVDYRNGDKDEAFALVKGINALPASPSLPAQLPDPPKVPGSYVADLAGKIASADALTPDEQWNLLGQLQARAKEGRHPDEIRGLLARFRARDDLLAKVGSGIDALLETLPDPSAAAPAPVAESPVAASAAPEATAAPLATCPQCHTDVASDALFCPVCGKALQGAQSEAAARAATGTAPPALGMQPQPLTPAPYVPAASGLGRSGASHVRQYRCDPNNTMAVIANVRNWLVGQDYETQEMATADQGVLLQIRRRGGWREIAGMATSVNVVFHQVAETLTVEIGAGKWSDKAVAGAVSLFVLWPLAVTAGFGAYEQAKLPEKILDYIAQQLSIA
jgi:hypothetical protein